MLYKPGRSREQAEPDDIDAAETNRPTFEATSSWPAPADIEPRQWLCGKSYLLGAVGATIADGGTGKSIFVLTEAVAMATGRPLLGVELLYRCKVLYWNGEESHDQIVRQVTAICLHHGIDRAEIADWLFVASGHDHQIAIASAGRDGIAPGDVSALCDFISEHDIDALIIDPFVDCHRCPENDNVAIDFAVKQWARIAASHHMAVELVHHTRKPPFGGQAISGVDDGRGASAFKDAVRSARVLNAMTEAEGRQAGVDNYRAFIRLDTGKSNYAPLSATSTWFQKVSVILPNGDQFTPGDNLPVVISWRFPGAFDNVTETHMQKVRDLARDGSYRADARSPEWIGRAVADVLDIDAESDKTRIKAILKTWVATGVLKVVERKAGNRHMRLYVVPGDYQD
jgi:hypothetical protein